MMVKRKKKRSWRDKVHPLFIEATEAGQIAMLAIRSGQAPEEVRVTYHARIEEIRRRYPCVESTASKLIHVRPPKSWPPSSAKDSNGIAERLHWDRYHVPLWQDCLDQDRGDREARHRVLTTIDHYENRRFDNNWKPIVDGDADHSTLFENGIGLGLETLTENELSECFDHLCPCEKKFHDPDALKKQRRRFLAAIRRALVKESELVHSDRSCQKMASDRRTDGN